LPGKKEVLGPTNVTNKTGKCGKEEACPGRTKLSSTKGGEITREKREI